MSGSRHDPASTGSARPGGAAEWPAAASPHGYDRNEFAPGESRRDFPPRRPRVADEERRLLKETQAVFEGPARRHDIDDNPHIDASPPDPHQGDHRGDAGAQEESRPSRLYRE